jgi:TPR repeat protein
MPLLSLLKIPVRWISLLVMLSLLDTTSVEAKTDTSGVAELQTKAARGYVKQELELAADYFAGRGVPKDLTQSAYWYRKAADQGNPAAQVYLGYMYTVGMGVPQDKAEAVRWYRRAASAGNAEAEVNLGALYIRGDGVKQDIQEALRLLKSAAEKRDGRADAYLGLATYLGSGVAVDHTAAEAWFRAGAKLHDPEAEFLLASLDAHEPGRVPDLGNEAKLLRLSAAAGYVPAMHGGGLLLVNHPELAQPPEEATKLLLSAAYAGYWQSSAVLGILARDGRHLPQDQRVAYRWFCIAVLQGGRPAETYLRPGLQRMARNLADATIVEQEAAAWRQIHPNHDLFVYTNEMNPKYFPIQEVYAMPHTQQPEAGDQTEQPN